MAATRFVSYPAYSTDGPAHGGRAHPHAVFGFPDLTVVGQGSTGGELPIAFPVALVTPFL